MSKFPPSDEQPTGDRLDRAKELLRDALDRAPGDATEWVRATAGDDTSLADYVLSLLAGARPSEVNFRGVRDAAEDFVASQRPKAIGRYRILDTLGEGGMGTVYLAEQTEPVQRRVALKLVKLGMDSQAVVARFEHERQSLAMMEHDGIAKVHDCGTSERGQPYFVMELVRGTPIAKYCDEQRLSLRRRIGLLQQVCDAVQHAHQKGVVHRDLKPSNVLVVEVDGRPQIKVIDFGLAKALSNDLDDQPLLTEVGQIVGTVEYMAPEQADPANADVDTRADVYSLGVMLYELLIGSLPFADTELRSAGMAELQRVMREVEPPRPSARLTAADASAQQHLAEQRGTQPSALLRVLRTDLDWVAWKAMAKDRSERYESASALAADLQRFLKHEPLLAGPPSTSYRLRKFVRRYRAQVIAVGAVLVTAVIGAFVASWFAVTAYDLAEQKGKLLTAEATAKAEATENAAQLASKVREFDLLAGSVLHDGAVERERLLYPPWPLRIAAMQRWLADDVGALLGMRPAIEQTIVDLRARALPRSDATREADERAHPRWFELQQLRSDLAARERADAVRAGAELVLPEVPAEFAALGPEPLWQQATERVNPDARKRSILGEERLGLAMGRLATEQAAGTPGEATALLMLAWAWFTNGEDAKAREAADRALELATRDPAKAKQLHEELLSYMATREQFQLELLDDIAKIEAEVNERRTYEFEADSQRYLFEALVELLADIAVLESNQKLQVEQRLAWAQAIGGLTQSHPLARHTWQEAREAIAQADGVTASERYRGQSLELRDQDVIGLVPIGMNPATRLWEFYDLRSAWDGEADPATVEIPEHRPDGSIEVDEGTGIVFVLLPGGQFHMGSQSDDPNDVNYDPNAVWYVKPVNEVALSPFLLARHELTQGQWARLMSGDQTARWPSQYRNGATLPAVGQTINAAHPVTQVDWFTARQLFRNNGMLLPTEAQWEFACRAGTGTRWSCAREDLQHCANLSDLSAKRVRAEWPDFDNWDDGFVVTSPVDSKRANAWGFVHMHGNVAEWSLDELGSYENQVRPGDGRRQAQSPDSRVIRGGSHLNVAVFAKSAMRTPIAPSARLGYIGVRPARALRPLPDPR